jgi:hypothetical protein
MAKCGWAWPEPPRDGQVLPLSPNRFVSPDIDGLQVEFYRDAHGQVNALSGVHGEGRARYVRKRT